jgi:hypothetical protein
VNKKILLKIIFFTVILFSTITVTQFVRRSTANPYEAYTYTAPPIISIHSPLDYETYSSNDVSLNFTITKPEHGWLTSWTVSSDPEKVFKNKLSQVSIVIDGELYHSIDVDSDLSFPFSYHGNVNLENGVHNLTIIAHCDGWDLEAHGFWERYLPYNVTSDLTAFTVDTTPLFVSILYPESDSYETTENLLDVALNFTVNEPVPKLEYSLDGQANVTIAGNTTLTALTYGSHNVTVYAWDAAGNAGVSGTLIFSVAKSEPFPTVLVATASGASAALIVIGLLVYFKKHKH